MLRLFYKKNRKSVDIATKSLEKFELHVVGKPIGSSLTDFLNLNIDDIDWQHFIDISQDITLELSKINLLLPAAAIEFRKNNTRLLDNLKNTQNMLINYIGYALTDKDYYDYNFFEYIVGKDLFKSQKNGYTRIKQKLAFQAEVVFFGDYEAINNYVDFAFFENIKASFDIIETLKNGYFQGEKGPIGICYEVCHLIDACIVEMYELFKRGMIIKQCKNCGKYFVPARSDALYCDNISPQDDSKTCKEYGAYEQYKKNIKSDEIRGLYRKIYMQKQMLSKRNIDIELYKIDFEKFKTDSKKWKNDVKNGIKTDYEFLTWLKNIKKKEAQSNGKHTGETE